MRYLIFTVLAGILMGCSTDSKKAESTSDSATETKTNRITMKVENLDIQGHRGARGILPENSIVGFKRAWSLGVTTLELDVCITKDKQVIVSHEPWISGEYCLTPDRSRIPEEEYLDHNIYQMTTQEVQAYDCGGLMHPRFPKQGKVNTIKPLLIEVFSAMDSHAKREQLPEPRYNIEIKSEESGDNVFHPDPQEFSKLVYEVINENMSWEQVNIQSFDIRILQEFRKSYPNVRLAFLVEGKKDWKENIKALGFTPDIYSPAYALLDESIIADLKSEGMKVIPWTVNDEGTMTQLVSWGVDGIITDYPNVAVPLFK